MTYSSRDKVLKEDALRTDDLRLFLKQRDEALRTLDMDYARKMMPGASSDEVRLMALHKARYEAIKIPAKLRQASRVWLEQRGYGRIENLPWPPADELPE